MLSPAAAPGQEDALAGDTIQACRRLGVPEDSPPSPSVAVRSPQSPRRTVDLIGAILGLVVAAPLFALIALLVKVESPGPVFFRQKRLGQGMRPFTILKFRTMRVGASADAHRAYIAAEMSGNAPPDKNGLFKPERAEELTRVGGWLRRTSLDELPQLANVLRGEMSLVGPRPCIAYETEHFDPHHFERFSVPAGLTGLWQVSGRAELAFREALELDVQYARSRSLGLDLRILCKTPLALRGRSTC